MTDLIIPFITLVAMELVLGIDNIVFISILAGKLPPHQQYKARITGISLAVITRVLLLFSISWIMSLTEPLFTVAGKHFSGHSLILLIGGLFLIVKSTKELHHKADGTHSDLKPKEHPSFLSVVLQIVMLDIIFSVDSVITAVGMSNHLDVMIAAVVVSTIGMVFMSGQITKIIEKFPSLKVLALSFLLMIGFTLIVESLEFHVPKGYVYFAMAFSIAVEILIIMKSKKVSLSKEVLNLNKGTTSVDQRDVEWLMDKNALNGYKESSALILQMIEDIDPDKRHPVLNEIQVHLTGLEMELDSLNPTNVKKSA